MVEHLRADLDLGLVAMVSYSIIMRIGAESYVARAAQAGFDGLIVPDLPLEQADAVCEAAGAAGLVCSLLVAPTTPDERVERIARRCSGFVYVLGHAGLTGERTRLSADLRPRIEQVRNVTDLPIAVGFGVSGPDQVKQVVEVADAAIVGSAIVRRIEEHRDSGPGRVVEEVERFVGTLAAGL